MIRSLFCLIYLISQVQVTECRYQSNSEEHITSAHGAYSEAAVCLVEQGCDPAKAMEQLGERNIGKSMLTAMAGAGLTGDLGAAGSIDATGLSTSGLITAYAKQELIRAAVNETLAATIDGQDLGQAMLQGIITAGISTAAAFGAHKIDDLHKPSGSGGGSFSTATVEPISGATHKLLHTALGAGLGATTTAITGDDIGRGAASGGFGALVGTLMNEAMVDDKTPKVTAQRITQMSDLITTTLALAVGLDPVSAYAASHNANEHNFKAHHLEYLKSIGMIGSDAEKIAEILDDKDSSPAKKAEIRKVLAENPKLARSLIMQKYAQTQLLEASRLERLSGDLNGDTYASRLSFDALDADGLQSTRERAQSLRLSAYRTIAHANDYLNQFAKENPALANYAVKGLKFAGAVLHAGAYVTAFATGGPVGTATLFAIEQTVSKSLEAAIEVGAEHAAKSARSPAEADILRQGFYEMAGKGTLLLGAAGIAKVAKGKGTGNVGAKPKVARDDFYVPQSQTGSRFLEFDTRARGLERAGQRQTATLELSYNVGSRQAFDRKLTALQDLAERGKLHKIGSAVRDESVTIAYRKSILSQAKLQWGATDPARVQRVDKLLKTLHADHLHELQLGGLDHKSALSMLDKQVNTSVGAQIMHQIKDLPVGTKITKVVEKAAGK